MELAIPIVALGGLYVLSNQDEEQIRRETFVNSTIVNKDHSGETSANQQFNAAPTSVNNNTNVVTDRYFKKPDINKLNNNGIQQQVASSSDSNTFESLSGNQVDLKKFEHNNMQPFFGSHVKGYNMDSKNMENVLDNMVGLGSQHTKKGEQAPLFKPQKNLNFANGAPNQSEFIQSRVVPGSNMANIKPWEEVQVGPGLNQGYSSSGTGGFNSGMEARNEWTDRNVDQLRTVTNPKVTYSLDNHQGPANFYNALPTSQENQGKVEKHNPDTYFLNTPDRWLTTTGIEKKQTSRAIEMNKPVNRSTTTSEYYGNSANLGGNNTYTPQNFEKTKRQELITNPVLNCKSNRSPATESDFGRPGYVSLPNNRSSNEQDTTFGVIGGMAKAAFAPLMDVLRPNKKENVIGNGRIFENAGSSVPAAPIYNPQDRPAPTIKDTTLGKVGMNHLNVQNQNDGGYKVSKPQIEENNRMTTNYEGYGNAGGTSGNNGIAVYNAAYNQRNNVNKTHKNRPNQGNMSVFNGAMNVCTSKNDCDIVNQRKPMRQTSTYNNIIPSTQNFGEVRQPQTYQDQCNDRIDPGLLNAFKKNPYTQSLNSY